MKRLMLAMVGVTCMVTLSFAQAKQPEKKAKAKTETVKKDTVTKKKTEVKKVTPTVKKEAAKPAEKKNH
jgi:hypothetical protein